MLAHYLRIYDPELAPKAMLHFASRSPRDWNNFHVVDILDRDRLLNVVKNVNPEVVINAAVYGDIMGCERNPELAFETNSEGQRNVISVCNKVGAKVVYISTNSVFCGESGKYTEDLNPHPGTVYGRSKLAGEVATREEANDWLILRVTALFGEYDGQMDFVQKIIHELSAGNPFQCWEQVITPTFGSFAAKVIMDLVEKKAKGVWHVGGRESFPRYEIGELIREKLMQRQLTTRIGTIDRIPTPVGLPSNRSFSVVKLKRELPELEFPDFSDCIDRLIK